MTADADPAYREALLWVLDELAVRRGDLTGIDSATGRAERHGLDISRR